jgi:double-stranded uracil-DNA glycosylase
VAAASLKRCFPPVADERTRLLLLGSLPGEESLAQGRYYANPRNQFWRLMESVVGAGLVPLAYEARLRALLEAGVGLWDTVGSARRRGSLDGNIRGHSANDLAALAASLPALRAVGFNGGKSASLGMPRLAESGVALLPLPSSSPAFTLPFESKLAEWMKLRAFL